MTVTKLREGLYLIDLRFQRLPGVIASYLIEHGGERALVETGPTSTLDALLAGLAEIEVSPESISKLLVTHIHLDHAGAAGTFMRRFPAAHLYVHEIGAPHMVDPSKLLTSATRIYGDRMETLWGAFEPVPQDRLTSLSDGDEITVGNSRITVLYTPGHASHHVAYHDPDHDIVFAGDVAAVRLQGIDYVRPPTPPPDVDLEAWDRSLQRMADLRTGSLALTHFGPFSNVDYHLDQARHRLHGWAELVERAQQSGRQPPEILDMLRAHGDEEIRAATDDPTAIERYEQATPYGMTVDGYLRYFRKRAPAAR